ncbi:MAG: transcriptional regulator, partial [Gemmatimonadetes bacterium]|nr:transcriptional regulator [Gemmatimonadota bacterium]
HVYWFNDRIEFLSPGGAFGAVTISSFGEPGLVDYRNPNLADAMRTLGFVQRFGVGIPIAKNLLAEAGHPEPEFDISNDFVRVTVKARGA